MAYMNQEKKAKIAANLKKVVPDGWKYSLAVRNHSTIVFTLRQAPVDILGNIRAAVAENGGYQSTAPEVTTYWSVNPYHIDTQFSGDVLKVMRQINEALNDGNHDNSDIQSDYFDVGWYVDLNIGLWNDPFLDTVPAPKRVAKVAASNPVAFSNYSMFLPSEWSGMSAGKKAAATKKAKAMWAECEAAKAQ